MEIIMKYFAPVSTIIDFVAATVKVLETWQQRHISSMQLARVDTHTLQDIGISDAKRFIEVNEPFWE